MEINLRDKKVKPIFIFQLKYDTIYGKTFNNILESTNKKEVLKAYEKHDNSFIKMDKRLIKINCEVLCK